MENFCYPSWSRKTLTFSQLEDVLNVWFKDTEDFEMIFKSMASGITETDRHIENNRDKIATLMQTVAELQACQRCVECELFDICCNLRPLEDQVTCLENILGCPPYYDCGKLCLYSAVESLFNKVTSLRQFSEELASLLDSQRVFYKITSVLSLDEKILRGLIPKIEETENLCQSISQQHQCLPRVPVVSPLYVPVENLISLL